MSSDYFGFIYQWTNIKNRKKYIGSHAGKITDNYIGSGKYFRRAYRKCPELFERSILEYVYESVDMVKKREQYYLDLVPDIVTNKDYYNVSPSASGGNLHGHLSPEKKKRINKKAVQSFVEAMKNKTPEERSKLREKKRLTWKARQESGIQRSKNISQKQKDIWRSRTKEELEQITQLRKELYATQPTEWHETRSKNMSNGIKKWHETKDPELEKQRIENMMQTKKLKQLRYIHNKETTTIKQVPLAELDNWLNAGWAIGMGIKRSTQSSSSPSLS
jgi:hypothetical protein